MRDPRPPRDGRAQKQLASTVARHGAGSRCVQRDDVPRSVENAPREEQCCDGLLARDDDDDDDERRYGDDDAKEDGLAVK